MELRACAALNTPSVRLSREVAVHHFLLVLRLVERHPVVVGVAMSPGDVRMLHADDAPVSRRHRCLRLLAVAIRTASVLVVVDGICDIITPTAHLRSEVHCVGHLVRDVHIVALVIPHELLTVHGLLRVRELELGRSLEACRGHLLSKLHLGEIRVCWQDPVQTIGQRATFI